MHLLLTIKDGTLRLRRTIVDRLLRVFLCVATKAVATGSGNAFAESRECA